MHLWLPVSARGRQRPDDDHPSTKQARTRAPSAGAWLYAFRTLFHHGWPTRAHSPPYVQPPPLAHSLPDKRCQFDYRS